MKSKLIKAATLIIIIAIVVFGAVFGVNYRKEMSEYNMHKALEYNYCEGDWIYSVTDGEAYIEYCKNLGTRVEIPAYLGGYPVVGEGYYKLPERIREIVVPDGFHKFSYHFFTDTKWYKNQPEGVVYLGNTACFYRGICPEDAVIEIKEGTKYLSHYSLSICGAKEIILPEGLISIGFKAFNNCNNLESIVIPESVTEIGSYAFSECKNLKTVMLRNPATVIGDDCFPTFTRIEFMS